ncbi:MAG: type II toxin-antitoxin system RelE/ParE family toxin [Terracidiphilus sp.]|jgi:hypothetical protein
MYQPKDWKTQGQPAKDKSWPIIFHDDFVPEFNDLSKNVQRELIALTLNLCERGPLLGRPQVDTLKGSRHSNMKELRFDADGGVWRVAFAFDPERRAILLVAGDKGGVSKGRFYQNLIRVADRRFDQHLNALRSQKRK